MNYNTEQHINDIDKATAVMKKLVSVIQRLIDSCVDTEASMEALFHQDKLIKLIKELEGKG